MTALQASIGTLNDLVDAPRDAGRKPGKPIPAGTVSIGTARSVAVGAAAVGLAPVGTIRRGHVGTCGRHPRDRLRLRPSPARHDLVVVAVRGRHPVASGLRLAGSRRTLPASFRSCSFRRRCSRARRWRSPTPEPTSSATSQRASPSVATALDCSGPGSSMPRYWESCSSSPSEPWRRRTCPTSSSAQRRRGGPRHVRDGRRPSRWSGRPRTGLGTRGGRGRGARRGLAGRRHRRRPIPRSQRPPSSLRTIAIAFSRRSFAIVRYLARFARSVDADDPAELRIGEHPDQRLDRLAEALLRVDERVVGQRGRGDLGHRCPRATCRPRPRLGRRPPDLGLAVLCRHPRRRQ